MCPILHLIFGMQMILLWFTPNVICRCSLAGYFNEHRMLHDATSSHHQQDAMHDVERQPLSLSGPILGDDTTPLGKAEMGRLERRASPAFSRGSSLTDLLAQEMSSLSARKGSS